MAAVSAYAEVAILNWLLGGAAATQPATRGAGLSLGSPTPIAGSEIATASGYTRQTVTFSGASTTGATATGTTKNANAMTFGPFSSAQSISGIIVTDTLATGGNLLLGGLLTTARTIAPGDSLVMAIDALIITLV